MATNNFREKANFIWSIADPLRGHYKQADYGKVILPFTVLRRLDAVLQPTKKDVLAAYQKHKDKKPEVLEPILNNAAKAKFHNRSKFDFAELAKDHNNTAANLRNYINGFSISSKHNKPRVKYFDPDTCEIIEDEIPKWLVNMDSFGGSDDYDFLKSCYSQEDNFLKQDISDNERDRLIAIFREYSYQEFLKVAEDNIQLKS